MNGVLTGATAYLQIEGDDREGYYLLHFNTEGQSFADTRHDTLHDAFGQATFEFGLGAGDWLEPALMPQ